MISTLSKWVCPPPETHDEPDHTQDKVEWFRCVPYILIHLGALLVFFTPFAWPCLAVLALSYAARMFAITAFYHRYFSHRTFKTSRIVQFIGAFTACASGQRGPLWWAAHHRMHHRHSDTDKDSHSPHHKNFLWSHTLWFMTDYALPTFLKEIPDWVKFKELRFINRFDWIAVVALAAGCYYLGEWPFFQTLTGMNGLSMLAWGFFLPTVLLYHATFSVNSLTHMFGKKKYDTGDESRNNWFVSIITFGEGWHNNHHFFPGSARQGFTPWEFDPTYYCLKFLSLFGLVRELRPVPAWVKTKAKH
ncbi:MAG: acyl-CoA desaturase [Opitutae bacterium]|jgi:stearoyl-CoA desaturase (delta-9 desaturase)|nr:fatty acid desaturase [Verrucomicrobiota bacterium]MDA0906307.1 fatty acid desaturase [Verrucomicrobiota bacterium]NDH00703.1 acyl-CoA desaturase [Opitutae bacterium]